MCVLFTQTLNELNNTLNFENSVSSGSKINICYKSNNQNYCIRGLSYVTDATQKNVHYKK